MRKKELIFFLFSVIILSGFVSAGPIETMSSVVKSTIDAGVGLFGPLGTSLFGEYGSNDFLFAKLLVGILLFVVVSVAIKKIPAFEKQKGVSIIISLIVSILSIRYISNSELIGGILLPYGTMGIAITTLLPFIIFFYFIHSSEMGGFARRAAWFVFGIIFLVLWSYKSAEISDISDYIYMWTLIGVILAFIFDKNIRKYFGAHELGLFYKGANQKTIAALQSEYLTLLPLNTSQAESRKRAIERQLSSLNASLP